MKEKNNTEIDNPYLDNRIDWNEIYAKEKSNAVMWRMFSLLLLLVTAFAVGGMIYASQLPTVVPYLFKEDASGGITALGIPTTELKVDNRMLANQFAGFITALRQVPSSDEMRKPAVHLVRMMSTSTLFRGRLAQMLKDEYAATGNNSEVTINIKTVMPVAKDTWEIDWVEFKNGAQIGKFKATLNYVRTPMQLKNPTELIWNPLGIIIKDINISQVIGS
jgi:type IV secretory pathway TrbF-like protein